MVDGNMRVNGTVIATAVNQLSDRVLKTNITPLSSPLTRVLSLSGYSFTWKSTGKKDIGLIAQEVEKVYPDLVSTDSNTGLKSVQYANLVAPMIEAMKEQQATIERQNSRIDVLEKENARMQSLESRLEKLESKKN